MGSITFAQVSKNVNTSKTPSRKVIDADVKNLPTDPESNIQIGEIKGESLEKHRGDESAAIHKGGTFKGSSIQKSSDASAGTGTIKGEVVYEKQSGKGQKNSETIPTTTQKRDFTIKSNGSENKTIKGSGTQSQSSSSLNFTKIGDIKGEKEK